MKNLNTFEAFMDNFAKTRKFPENQFEIYDLNKRELGNYLNTWFEGDIIFRSDLPQNKIKKRNPEFKDYLIRDEMWTVKEVDKETASNLYNRKYNPISIKILSKEYEKGKIVYEMKAMIHSVDDSSFGIWWGLTPLEELKEKRFKLMQWINASVRGTLNGEEFFEVCIGLGADEETKDYN